MPHINPVVDPRYGDGRTIPPILYHGTTARFLADNTKEGVYSNGNAKEAQTGLVHTDSKLSNPLYRAVINWDIFKSTPKLLVVKTSMALEGISREPTEKEHWVPFEYLRAASFIGLDIELPETRKPYTVDRQEIAGLNVDQIEKAMQDILGLEERVSILEINSNEDIFSDN